MEKLIELLNEYNEGGHWRDENFDRNKLLVISKGYGFIKWLVENDKIDKKKLDEAERRPMYVTDDMFSLYKVDECVIMLLSISDTPTEDLISYLK